jgi:membrane-associated phospholipid phosphatase
MEKNILLKIFKVKNYLDLSAKLISLVLNPVVILIPLPFYLILETTNDFLVATIWTIVSFLYIFLFFVFIAVGVKFKFFSDFDISHRKQRPMLYLVAIFLVFEYISVLYLLSAPKILFIATLALTLGLIILQMVNNYVKASAHVATIIAFVTSMILIHREPLYFLAYIPVILVIWSRIRLKRHTPFEAAVGGILGIILSIIIYTIAIKIY